ncbi:MAG: hypothetical protein GY868_05735, partial [Deltaproteobacteria bacterium]|nr:hypothetical protein [Deltaproteobacteria bacterium]
KIKLGDQGPLKSRPVMVAGAGLFMLIVVLLFVKALMEPGEEPLPEIDDLSNQPIDLPLEGVIGYTKTADQSHPDKAVFTFSAKSGRTTLYYTAGAVDADDEVAIFLNGNQIGAVPVAAQGWGDEQQLELPKNLVLKGGINRVTFDNTRSPPALEMWAIKEVRVETQEAVACDEQAAKKLFALADVRLTEKDADQGNLYRAFRSYADGIALLESCSPTPALLAEMEKKQRRTKEELDKRYDSLVFSVKRAVNLEQYDQAGVILEAIMRLIPDPRDGRHQEAQAYYKKITEAALGWQEE